MENEIRLKNLEIWLKAHGAENVGDKVFDKQGVITKINKGYLQEYIIQIMPLRSDRKLGAGGYGQMITIDF